MPLPDRARRLQRLARVLLVVVVLLPAAFTLGDAPTGQTALLARVLRHLTAAVDPVQLDEVSTGRVEFLANVLLFVPLGVLLPVAFPRLPLTLLLLVPAGGSLAVEVAQRLVVPGRTPDLVDVVANSTGGALGLLVGADLVRWAVRRGRGRRRLVDDS